MGQLVYVLALDHPDWTIPWAGLGAFLLGVGSFLSGFAALKAARGKGKDESSTVVNSRSDSSGGERVSDIDRSESGGTTGSDENGDD
jgi:hypothetical protein